MNKRITVREARRTLSQIMKRGDTVAIGHRYGEVRGFIVGVPEHYRHETDTLQNALKHAKAKFTAAWIAEAEN
jgi:hypothetical protein